MQNGSVESFNGRFRGELLNEHAFPCIHHARFRDRGLAFGLQRRRPHTSLGGLTKAELIETISNDLLTVPRGLTWGGLKGKERPLTAE